MAQVADESGIGRACVAAKFMIQVRHVQMKITPAVEQPQQSDAIGPAADRDAPLARGQGLDTDVAARDFPLALYAGRGLG
jgi:hypothetical protein